MLVTLANMKTYLGISGTDYDAFLTSQITLISDAIESYCGRKFLQANYLQTFYAKDFSVPVVQLALYHFPVSAVSSIEQDEEAVDVASYRLHKPSGILTRGCGFLYGTETVIVYTAGYAQADIPSPIQNAVYSLVEERYNKKISGVNLNFGSDVQRISIPGTISIDFDYSLNNNERKSAFGALIGSQANVLDFYRSDRAVIGSGKLEYVEVSV